MDWSVPVLAERDTQDGAERAGCPLAPGTLVEGI